MLIEDSSNVSVTNLQTERNLWGVRVLGSTDVVVASNTLLDTGQEAIHVGEHSTCIRLEGNRIDVTGQRSGGKDYGEGIYLGTADTHDGGEFDVVSDVTIVGNHISNTTAEAIELKSSVENVVIRENLVHDIEVHSGGAISVGIGERTFDADVIIEENAIWNVTTRSRWADGIGIRLSSSAVVRSNVVFNTADYGVLLDENIRPVDGSVAIEGNLIFSTGRAEVVDRSAGTGTPVIISGTISGEEARELLEGLGQSLDRPSPVALLAALSA